MRTKNFWRISEEDMPVRKILEGRYAGQEDIGRYRPVRKILEDMKRGLK